MKHKQQKKPVEERLAQVYGNHYSSIQNMLNDLSYRLYQYQEKFNNSTSAKRWLTIHSEERTDDILSGYDNYKLVGSWEKCRDPDQVLRGLNLFLYPKWQYRITNKFVQNAFQREKDPLRVIALMSMILAGEFNQNSEYMSTTVIKTDLHLGPMQCYFRSLVDLKISIIFEVAIEKIPILSTNKTRTINGYQYVHVITFIDFRTDSKLENQLRNIVYQYHTQKSKDQSRQDYQNLEGHASHNRYRVGKNLEGYLFKIENAPAGEIRGELEFGRMQTHIQKWLPCTFQPIYLTEYEIQNMVYDFNLKRWTPKDYLAAQEQRKFRDYQQQINRELLKRYADFSSAAKLVELLQKIPNFKIKLTPQEQQVVGADGSVMVIGRSGTGKTTCAILRLFAMEMLFSLRLNLYKQKHEKVLQNTNYTQKDMDNCVGLHCVFATASPVLTAEVKRYYIKLTDQIKTELEKKRQRDLEKKKKEQEVDNQLEQSGVQIVDKQQLKEMEDKYFEKQMGGIELKEDQGGFESDQDLDDIENEDEQMKQEQDKFTTFKEMTEKDFPAFFTVKKLLQLVDASLERPFFARTKDSKVIGSKGNAQWHNENNGILMINNYKNEEQDEFDEDFEDDELDMQQEEEDDVDNYNEEQLDKEYQRQMYLMNKQNKQKTQNEQKNELSQEVDYEYFQQHFWPTISRLHQTETITCNLLWTQIYSHIKGSASTHKYPTHYLPKRAYITSMNSLMTPKMLDDIFELFILYERWKTEKRFYDLMDVVNHIITQLSTARYDIIPIHYLMIDEVQDLPHAMLVLLCKITEQGLFFSGDTAQNIAKGVGFRFQDLKSIFNQKNHFETYRFDNINVHQLTTNFRSHNNILQMANSLVTLLEIFFPRTIDKLQKERSDIMGPKPIVINEQNPESLFYLLSGEDQEQNELVGQRLPIEFGCNQAIIVRDQESKKKVPNILQHALILTIYEAKGLEFDDVILYNFFTDAFIGEQQWNLMHYLDIKQELIEKADFESQITRHKQEKIDDQEELENIYGFLEKDGKIEVQKLVKSASAQILNLFNYSSLCNDLKQLYVAVTRPRQRLIIYDEKPQNRKFIQQIWQKLDLIDNFDANTIKNRESSEKIAAKTSAKEWKKQGIKMFRNKFYEQAYKCFSLAQEQILMQKAQAYYLAEEGTNFQSEIKILEAKAIPAKDKKKQLKLLNAQKQPKFREAAEIFIQLGNLKQAAQCYYSADDFQKALELYQQTENYKEAGEAAYACKLYQESAQHFLKHGDIIRCIDAYEKCEDWESIFKALHQHQELPFETKSAFLMKYLPIVLNKMSNQVGQLQDQTEENEENQEKQKQKLVIQEEDEDSDDSEEDSDEEQQKSRKESKQIQEEQQIQELTSEQISFLKNDTIPLIKQESLDVHSENSQSFSVQNSQLEQSQSFQVEFDSKVQSESFQIEESRNENFEHLSHYDPDDQWLQTEDKKSIVDSIHSKLSEHSDFSAFSYAQIQNNPNMQLVKTKGDIFIQDSVMQEIIKYISMFSDEFKQQLNLQRSSQAQLSNNQNILADQDYIVDFILDLDLVDISFIYLVLDILESFKNFKLCIFVCNRYKLADKLGRYLISIAASYSPLALQPSNMNPIFLANGQQRTAQIEKGLVAAFAVHNVFENINPEFLRLKFEDEELNQTNSLGLHCYSQMVMLGFWKKIVYQLDSKNALKLFEVFMDFKNWKFIYFTNRIHMIENSIKNEEDESLKQVYKTQLTVSQKKLELCFQTNINFEMLYFEEPRNEQDIQLALISLEQYYNEFTHQLVLNQLVSESVFFRSGTQDPKVMRQDLSKINLPKIFTLTESVFRSLINKQEIPIQIYEQLIENVNKKNTNGINSLKIYEASYLLLLIMELANHSHTSNFSQLIDQIEKLPHKLFIQLESSLRRIMLTTISIQDSSIGLRHIFKRCLLFRYKCRLPESEILNPFLNSLFVHRSSILISNLIERKKQLSLKGKQIVLDDYYFADIDMEFINAPHNQVLQIIYSKISSSLKNFIYFRNRSLLQYYDELVNFPKALQADVTEYADVLYSLSACQAVQQRQLKNLNIIHKQQQQVEQEIKKDDLLSQYAKKEQQAKLKKEQQIRQFQLGNFNSEQVEEQIVKSFFKFRGSSKLSEILRILHIYQSDSKIIEPEAYEQLLEQGLKYLEKTKMDSDIQKFHKHMVKGIILLNYLKVNSYSIAFINKQQTKKYLAYLHYIEYLVCKNHLCIDDATGCYLEFHSLKHGVLFQDEQVHDLTNLLIYQMIAYQLSNQKEVIFNVPYEQLALFNSSKYALKLIDENNYVWNPQIHHANGLDYIEEILQILYNLFLTDPKSHNYSTLMIVYILVLNMKIVGGNLDKIVKDICRYISQITDSQDLYKLIIKTMDQKDIKDKKALLKDFQTISIELYTVKITNQLKSENDFNSAYQECLEDWDHVTKHKILKERVLLIENRYLQYRTQNRMRKNQIVQQILHFDLNEYKLSRKLRQSKWIQIYNEFALARKLLVSTLYSMYIDNPIDCHFITQQLCVLREKELKYQDIQTQFETNKISISQFSEVHAELFNDVSQFIQNFIQWQKNNAKFEQNLNKLLERNRKMLALKWMNQKAGMKLQKIQKRKKGLKRQELLEKKKLFLKF